MNTLRQKTWSLIEWSLIHPSDCKYLEYHNNRKSMLYFRGRGDNQCYYHITLKGNHIRAYRIKWLDKDNNAVNLFMTTIVNMGEDTPLEPAKHSELICKYKFKKYKQFIQEFRDKTPELCWAD